MSLPSKARVQFCQYLSEVGKGMYCFFVHAEDQILFKHEMARMFSKSKQGSHADCNLTLSLWHKPKTRPQENMYRKILREICTQEQSDAYGSDPDNVHEGVLALATLSYGYPSVPTIAGVRVPKRSRDATTKELNLLMEVARVVAGESKADVSHIGSEE